MLKALLFDQRRGEPVEDWRGAARELGRRQVLWVDLEAPSDAERREVEEALGTNSLGTLDGATPRLLQQDGRIDITLAAVNEQADEGPRPRPFRCIVGKNFVVTLRDDPVPVFDQFRELAGGEGELGVLDGPSFLAALVEWTLSSYLRAFEAIDQRLEEFDLSVLSTAVQDHEAQIGVLVDSRRRIGRVRRSLAPQRELFTALSHAEFDLISSTESAERFNLLTRRVDDALVAARDAKDSVFGSFDVLIARTEHRTNEVVKVLTLASVLLLPGTLIAGILGMNFKVELFEHTEYFWGVIVVIVALGAVTLMTARRRHWI